jgi:hypothetical protein
MLIENHAYRNGRAGLPLLMLSVAGRWEAINGRPAAGAAGTHLAQIVKRLHAARPDLAPDAAWEEYPILNAHPGIEYAGLTGRTEAPVTEYLAAANISRVIEYVAGRPVFAFGARARRTCRAASIAWVMTGPHPSSLNRIPNRVVAAETAAGRMRNRYNLAAKLMLDSLSAG